MVRPLTADEVTFTVEALPEDIPVRGNAMASGDDAADKEYEDEIISRLDSGDIWAWCHVLVKAKWNGYEGTAGLGGCCYRDEKEFCQPGGYYDDLCTEALHDLNNSLASHARRLEPVLLEGP